MPDGSDCRQKKICSSEVGERNLKFGQIVTSVVAGNGSAYSDNACHTALDL